MYNTIILVSRSMKNVLEPVSKGIFGIGVLRSINVEAQVNTNLQVTQIAELKFSIGQYQKGYKNKSQRVFQEPILYIGGAGYGSNPYGHKHCNKRYKPDVFSDGYSFF